MLYLASGVLCISSAENQLEGFGGEDRGYTLSRKGNSIGLTFKILL